MALVYSYVDGSGRLGRDRVITSAGVVGYVNDINRFEFAWKTLLSRYELPNGLTMKEALLADKPLSPKIPSQSIDERIEALRPFAIAIRKNLRSAVAISIDTDAFKQLPDAAKTALGTKPDFLAFASAMMVSGYHSQPDDKVSIVSDDDEEIAWDCYRFYRQLKSNSAEFRRKTPCITFADDTVFVALQAADMLAALWRRHGEFIESDRPYDYQPLLRAIVSDTDRSEEMIHTHPWHWGKETLVSMADEYTQWGKRLPMALLPSLAADF